MTSPHPVAPRPGRGPRRVLAVVLTAVALVLSACGGGGGGGDTDELRRVVIWDRAGAQATIKQQWFETWNTTEGAAQGIEVSYEPQAADKYEELVRVAFQTGRGPDIFHTPSSQLGGFVAAGWVQPLTDLVEPAVLESAAPYLGKNSELVWGGEPYAIPTTSFVNRLVINRELFTEAGLDPDNPPATFSELVDASKKIAETSPGKVYGFGLPLKWVGFRQWTVDLPIMASEPDLTNGLFNQATGRYESEKYVDMITAYRQMIADESAYPGAATLQSDAMIAAFAKGEIGMVFNSSSIVAALGTYDSKVDVGTAQLPVADGSTFVRSPMNAGYPYGISAKSEEPEAAAAVLQALVGDPVQEALAEGDAPPLNPTVWDSEVMQGKDLLMSFRPTETDQQWPKNPNAVVPVEGQGLDQTIVSLVLDPDLPLESTLADLQQRYQTAYDQAVSDGDLDPAEFTR